MMEMIMTVCKEKIRSLDRLDFLWCELVMFFRSPNQGKKQNEHSNCACVWDVEVAGQFTAS
jgi:hypothetical protein